MRIVSLMKQELPTLPEHTSSNLILVVFVYRNLKSFCIVFGDHYYPLSCGFIMLSALRCTTCYYPFDILQTVIKYI